ncbi:MAG: hypothetical protein P0S95_04960 [Rhabdochlamydiaceae bacterium]|nr:hypothetical protein [Candidatus Amphrikana amoebophyrae]
MAFFNAELSTRQKASIWRSEGPKTSPKAAKLQHLFDENKVVEYETLRGDFESRGSKFRLTKGKIFQIFPSEETMNVPLKFQVKGGCMTWYIVAPMDETHQSFRDEVYQAAALGHLTVKNHCEKYWRGTNSLHVKKMHTDESESMLNHNHYRVRGDRDVGPEDVQEHLFGFVKAQLDMGLIDRNGEPKYLGFKEAKAILHDYKVRWIKDTHEGAATEVIIDGEVVELPDREHSIISEYKASPKQKLTLEDRVEWEENKHLEKPCITIGDSTTLDEKRVAIKAGMRGLGSHLAQTRQVKWSVHRSINIVVKSDDVVKKTELVASRIFDSTYSQGDGTADMLNADLDLEEENSRLGAAAGGAGAGAGAGSNRFSPESRLSSTSPESRLSSASPESRLSVARPEKVKLSGDDYSVEESVMNAST